MLTPLTQKREFLAAFEKKGKHNLKWINTWSTETKHVGTDAVKSLENYMTGLT